MPPPFDSLPNSTSSASGFLSVLLDDAGERPGAEQAVVALLGQPAARAQSDELDEDLAVGELHLELGHELVDHLFDASRAETGELMMASRRLRNSGANSRLIASIVLVVPRLAAEAQRRLGDVGGAGVGGHASG